MKNKRWSLDDTKPLYLEQWAKKIWIEYYSYWINEAPYDVNFQNSINTFVLEADEVTDLMKLLSQNFNFFYIKNNFELVFSYLLNFLCRLKFFLSDIFMKITLKLEQENSFKTSVIVHSNLSKLKETDLELIMTKDKQPNLQTIKEYKMTKNSFYYLHKINYSTRRIYLDKLIKLNFIEQESLNSIEDLSKNIKLEQDLRNQFAHYRISIFNIIKSNNKDLLNKYKFYLEKIPLTDKIFKSAFDYLNETVRSIYFKSEYNIVFRNVIEQILRAFYLDELIDEFKNRN